MTLFNKTAIQDDHIDRINDLPSNVIDGILEHLDIKELVRTSILSRKWRYMWTLAPQLWFGEDFMESFKHLDDAGTVVSKIITDVLMLHNGPINKFSLFIPYDYNFKIIIESINTWIPFLSRRDIKHLELENCGEDLYQMPYTVLSCKELTYFKFSGFNLSIPPNFCGFKRLLNLHLSNCTFESGALEGLISGCLLLEKLSIQFCEGFEYFDFSVPTLKVLLLQFHQEMKSICLKKAKNLSDLTIRTHMNTVSGLIKTLPKIQRFAMQATMISYADIIPPTLLISSFSSLEYLDLNDVNLNERGELLYIVSVLKSAPNLVELVIKSYEDADTLQVSDHSKELECSRYCLNNLQTVNIYLRARSQQAMSLIQFILANSTSLKTLTFNVKNLDASMLLRLSQDLLWMERASQRAHVKFLHGA